MKQKIFGTTQISVPVIGQGTWNFPTGKSEVKDAQRALRVGIDLGMTHIDTAEMYGSGASEKVMADVIEGVPRDRLYLVSKVLPSNATKKGTIEACERSLKRLRVDYLDCYLLHWRGSVPLSETIEALETLIDQGKIRAMGVSNFDVDDLEEALSVATKPITCNQILYNLETRGPELKLIPFCEKNDIATVAYTPFAQKRISAAGTKGGDVLREIASAHEATPRQVVLAFLVRQGNVFTIPKSANVEHTRENAEAGSVELSAAEVHRISNAFPAPAQDVPLQMI